ncbi:MAG: lamin tail domain-containing protein [Patescibacteria group bacterium]|nr:lamin tail domain-containing protein [Patescibacteria group bacterium]
MLFKTKSIASCLIGVAVVAVLVLLSSAALAYYQDPEVGGLVGQATDLDFILDVGEWAPGADVDDLEPGESVARLIRLVDDAPRPSTPFWYQVTALETGGNPDFCAALQLDAQVDGVPVYDGPLLSLAVGFPLAFDPLASIWDMRVYLPLGSPSLDDRQCDFDFVFQGWQERFDVFPEGYHDEEVSSNQLSTPETRQCLMINFETDANDAPIETGQRINDEYSPWGVLIDAHNNNHRHPDEAIIFDSDLPTGRDIDLGTPNEDFGGPGIGAGGRLGTLGANFLAQHNFLIIAENDEDANGDGLVDDPDDENDGGYLGFTFDQPSWVKELRLFDIEEQGAEVQLYDEAGINFSTIAVPPLGDNSAQLVYIDQENVKELRVSLPGSGAVDDICVDVPPPPILGCSPGFWKNHTEIWFDLNDPYDVSLLAYLEAQGDGAEDRRYGATAHLNAEFPEVAVGCAEEMPPGTPPPPPPSFPVVLNEFLPRPRGEDYGFDFGNDSSVMPQGEWVELYNNGDQVYDLSGWYVWDASSDENNKIMITVANTVPAATEIAPHDWLVVYLNQAVMNNNGDEIRLYDGADELVDAHSYSGGNYCEQEPTPGEGNDTGPSEEECNAVPPNKSYARIPDGVGAWVDPVPTPGAPNIPDDPALGITIEIALDAVVDLAENFIVPLRDIKIVKTTSSGGGGSSSAVVTAAEVADGPATGGPVAVSEDDTMSVSDTPNAADIIEAIDALGGTPAEAVEAAEGPVTGEATAVDEGDTVSAGVTESAMPATPADSSASAEPAVPSAPEPAPTPASALPPPAPVPAAGGGAGASGDNQSSDE